MGTLLDAGTDIAAQVAAARESAVMQARPTFGRLRLAGSDRAAFLHNMTTADIKRLQPGEGRGAVLVNQRAGILDWVDVYAGAEAHWVITGPGRTEADLTWLDRYLITEDVQLEDLASKTALLYVTGARADALVPGATGPAPHAHAEVSIADTPVHVMRTHALVGTGYHLLVPAEHLETVASALAARPLGEAAGEILRIEAGLPKIGAELVEARNPWEARLDGSLSLDKGCYLGQEVVARLNTYDKVQRYLVGLRWEGDAMPAPGAPLLAGETEVGALASAVAGSGLGYVKAAHAHAGTRLVLRDGDRTLEVTTDDRPFWAGKTRPVSFST